ncbi:flagellin C [Pseudaminobacter arsenicus]|uniref:Flagellin n=1 Tax=Borborobacter arsenicus TaxID=1851146 RepID=A0A432UZU3_9HYPH|nr:flagellin [Pseudaminobacter arsenicus]RUM95345.1 flagellin C [Pseudaminobacter arsenicus]
MSSILTNASAMTALKTLQQTNKGLEATQGRISTGLRVAQASDNAAYWSIATTMRSDNKAMSTVKDALGLGAAQVDVAYTAMDSVKNTLDKIKTKLVAASQPSVDKAKIQAEITQLQNDLKTFAESASFSGGNWLSINGAAEQKIVASFIRSDSGSISLGTIDIDTAKTALFNSKTGEAGLLEKGTALTAATNGAGIALYTAAPATNNAGTDGPDTTPGTADDTAAVATYGAHAAFVLDENDAISFDLTLNGGTAQTIRIDRATLDAAGVADGNVDTAAKMASVLNQALKDAGLDADLTAADNAGAVELTTTAKGTTATIAIANGDSTDNGNFFDATGLDITNADSATLGEYVQGIDSMLTAVTTAASDLGAIKSRISSQQEFVTDLMNAVDRGVGALVDANMNEESTRLQALQVQQQLGIQALSIANGSAQSILSLFRG